MTAEVIRTMRARAEECRRLAEWIDDPRARKILLQMAMDCEADIRKLEPKTGPEGP